MSTPELFNSKTKPIPCLRPDLDIIPVRNNGDSYLYFHDTRGYIQPNFAVDRSVEAVLSLLDGNKSINDLKPYLHNGTTTDQLLQYIQFLDKNRLLNSEYFKSFAENYEWEYEQAQVHQSVTAGSSYPDDPEELEVFLDEAFKKYETDFQYDTTKPIKALFAPHIDPRVGMKTYVESFQTLRQAKPKRVIILATSHYAGLHADLYKNKPFIVSNKDFEMALGTIPADRESVELLLQNENKNGTTWCDRAHRIEHSIELHLLFLHYIWHHDFSIVPILVGGFDDLFYMDGSYRSLQVENFADQLRDQFEDDDDTLFLISGDLAHVGKKFGDTKAAGSMRNEVTLFDKQFLSAAEKNAPDEMLNLMKHNYDPYRICGFPPLYTFLKTFPNLKGETISYDRWDETERESMVTFGSILYQ